MTIELTEKNKSGIINNDINQIIIPFSHVSSQAIEEFIYSGGEKIPFRERHPIFQALMLIEFVNT